MQPGGWEKDPEPQGGFCGKALSVSDSSAVSFFPVVLLNAKISPNGFGALDLVEVFHKP